MEKLGKRAQAILLDMICPAPKGKYFARYGQTPERGAVFKVDLRRKTVVFCKSKELLLSPEILAQMPMVPQMKLWTKPGWFAGWYYLVGHRTPEASSESGCRDPIAGSEG